MKKNDTFHKLNSVHVLILRKVNEKPRSIKYFMYCYETARMLTHLGYIKKKVMEKGNPFSTRVFLSSKGKAYLEKLKNKRPKNTH